MSARPPWWAYAWWLVVGALGGLGLIGILTIGLPLLLLAAVLVAAGCGMSSTRNGAAVAAVAGPAAPALLLAWLNREGPGEVCHPIPGGTECQQEWSPWPFVAVAVVLIGLAVVGAVLLRRQARMKSRTTRPSSVPASSWRK